MYEFVCFELNKKGMRVCMKESNKIVRNAVIVIISGLALLGFIYLYKMYQDIEIVDNYTAEKLKQSTINEQNVENQAEKSKSTIDLIENVTKSVCGISKLSNAGGSILSTATESELGLGTGIVISENGYILSNSHVTGEKYSTCYVTIEDKDTYTGTVLWADNSLDLSLIKIKATNLVVADIGKSKNLRVGETVYAIGNPVGFEFRRTVTSGIVSALNRTVKLQEDGKDVYMSDLIQTDATINPGNSGGPLINIEGKVIGVNSVKITSAEGIGFAIPIDVVKPVINSFIEKDKFEEANLGLYVYDETISQYLNKKNKYSQGVYIAKIVKMGPADGKGLKEEDIITKIDDKNLNTINDLREYIYTKKPGDRVIITISNGRYSKDAEITLGKK